MDGSAQLKTRTPHKDVGNNNYPKQDQALHIPGLKRCSFLPQMVRRKMVTYMIVIKFVRVQTPCNLCFLQLSKPKAHANLPRK